MTLNASLSQTHQEIIQYISTISSGTASIVTVHPGLTIYHKFVRNHPKNYDDFPELNDISTAFMIEPSIEEAYLSIESYANDMDIEHYEDIEDANTLVKCTTIRQLRLFNIPTADMLYNIENKYGKDFIRELLQLDGLFLPYTYGGGQYHGFITLFNTDDVDITPIPHCSIEEYQQMKQLNTATIISTDINALSSSTASIVLVQQL